MLAKINRAAENMHISHSACPGGYVTVSIGVCQINASMESINFEKEVSRADEALYEAKNTGRNKTVAYAS